MYEYTWFDEVISGFQITQVLLIIVVIELGILIHKFNEIKDDIKIFRSEFPQNHDEKDNNGFVNRKDPNNGRLNNNGEISDNYNHRR